MRRNDKSFERRDSPSWGEGRPDQGSQDGSRPPRREFSDRPIPERTPTAAEMDSQWRARMKPDAPVSSQTPTPDASTPSSPAAQPAAPATRPKLNLAKRTVSEVPQTEQGTASTPTGDAKASPFGAARPIDTAARDREIAEKRLAEKKKKEEEDKEREAKNKEAKEKAAAERAAERAAKGEKEPVTSPRENGRSSVSAKETGAPKENGSRPTFEILRRVTDQENGNADGEHETEGDARNASANGEIVGDKATLPQEVVRDVKSPEAVEGTAEAAEADGWSTIAGKKKKGRGGNSNNAGARAIAS